MPVANSDAVETFVDEEPASDSSEDSVVEPSSVEDATVVEAEAEESSSESVVEPTAEVPTATVESTLLEGPAEPEGEAPVVEVPVESAPVVEVPVESLVEPALMNVEVTVEEAALNDVVEPVPVEGDEAPTTE
jgi:ribonuclease E